MICNITPFQNALGWMIVEIIALIFWIDALPPYLSIAGDLIPWHIIIGITVDCTKHSRQQFGEYVQLYEENNNNMQARVTSAIALHPKENAQGAYFFIILATGRRLNRQQFAPLTLLHEVINWVHRLGFHKTDGLDLQDQSRRPLLDVADDDDDDSTYIETDYEGNGIDDSDNNPPPGHNATLESRVVTATDLHNIIRN